MTEIASHDGNRHTAGMRDPLDVLVDACKRQEPSRKRAADEKSLQQRKRIDPTYVTICGVTDLPPTSMRIGTKPLARLTGLMVSGGESVGSWVVRRFSLKSAQTVESLSGARFQAFRRPPEYR